MNRLESKSLVLLRHHLKALRLPTIGMECEKVARRAASDGSDHLTYLLQVTELELLERERKAAERRLKAARFPSIKSLESFDFTARASVNSVLIAELARCEFIDRLEDVLFVGNPRNREEPPGDRPCRRGLRQGVPGAVLPGHRTGDAADRGPG
jgi:DNA replication protein DnaC